MPRIAVVMACYNAMPYLPEAIDSVLNQSYRDLQLIAVDDGSTDASGGYLDQRSKSDLRMVVIHQKNQGQQAAANTGIAASDSEFIARMDADDVATLDRFEKQVAYLDANPNVGLCGGQIQRKGANKTGLVSNLPVKHDEIVSGLLKNHHTMCNPTIMFRRKLFQRIGGYWMHNIAEDWDMFLRMSEIAELANLSDCLLAYRLHTQSVNGRRIVEAQLYNEYAAELYQLRKLDKPEISFEEFRADHRCNKPLRSWKFYLDSHSIGQYRMAIAEIYSKRKFKGYARLGLSMMMSPDRTARRIINIVQGIGRNA
jgi:glycosyltransferase involved in cell wall biosynthesis